MKKILLLLAALTICSNCYARDFGDAMSTALEGFTKGYSPDTYYQEKAMEYERRQAEAMERQNRAYEWEMQRQRIERWTDSLEY